MLLGLRRGGHRELARRADHGYVVRAEAERHGDWETVRRRAIEGYVDVSLRHRQTLVMLVRDMTLLVQAPVAERFKAILLLANDLVCGPDRRLEQQMRASQVVAGLGDPIVAFSHAPPHRLRRLILDGVWALLDAGTGRRANCGTQAAKEGRFADVHRRDHCQHHNAGGRLPAPFAVTARHRRSPLPPCGRQGGKNR